MGKGYENYMSKKWFHPSNLGNMKRLWMAEQKAEAEKKQQQLLKEQHEKEQEMFSNRQLMGDEKARLGLSFMYNPPIGMVASSSNDQHSNSDEKKLEWRGAPREQWAKADDKIRDQPFGIQVRDVRCIKCRQWGHINTDKTCPLYAVSKADEVRDVAQNDGDTEENEISGIHTRMSNQHLLGTMKEDGLAMKKNAMTRDMVAGEEKRSHNNPTSNLLFQKLQRIVATDNIDQCLKKLETLSESEKKTLYRKLKKYHKSRKPKKTKK